MIKHILIVLLLISSFYLYLFKKHDEIDRKKNVAEADSSEFQTTSYFEALLKKHTMPEIKKIVQNSKYKNNNVVNFLVQSFEVSFNYIESLRGPYHEQLFFDSENKKLNTEEFYHLYTANFGEIDLEALVGLYTQSKKDKPSFYIMKAIQLYTSKDWKKSLGKINQYLSKVTTKSIVINRQLMSFYLNLYERTKDDQYLEKSLSAFFIVLYQVKEKEGFALNFLDLRILHLEPEERRPYIDQTRSILGANSNFNYYLNLYDESLNKNQLSNLKNLDRFTRKASLGIFYQNNLNFEWLSKQNTQILIKFKDFFLRNFIDGYNSYSKLNIKKNYHDASGFFTKNINSYLKLLVRLGQYKKLKDFISEINNMEHQSILTCFVDIAYSDFTSQPKDNIKTYCLDTYLNVVSKNKSSQFKFWYFENIFPFLSHKNQEGKIDPYYQNMRAYLNDGGWDYKENEYWLNEWFKYRFDNKAKYTYESTIEIALSWVGKPGVSDFDIYCKLMNLDFSKDSVDHDYAILAAESKKNTDNSSFDITCESMIIDSFADNNLTYKSLKYFQSYFDQNPSFLRLYLWLSAVSRMMPTIDKNIFIKNLSKVDFINIDKESWQFESFKLGAIGLQAIEFAQNKVVDLIVEGFEREAVTFSSAKFLSRYFAVKRRDCKKSQKYSQILQDKLNYMKVRDGYFSDKHKADEFDLLRNAAMCNFNIKHKPGGVPF